MITMATNKSQDKKDFLIGIRKSMGASVSAAPVWLMRKAGKRLYNKHGKKHWKQTSLGKLFKRKMKEQGKKAE